MPHSQDNKDVIQADYIEDTQNEFPEVEKAGVDLVADTDAAAYVDPDLVISEEESKALRRIIHRRVLPVMCLAYLTQALDKSTLGPSSIMGWLTDVGAQGQDYALASTVLWAGIIIGEPIANQLVRRLPVAKVLAVSMFIWSALLLGLAFSLRMPAVLAVRFLLGFSESVFGPCLLTITVQWYLKDEQPFIQAIWQSMFGVASSVVSLMGYGFYFLVGKQGGLLNWQWLTVSVAIISFIAGVITFFYLPDSPTSAKWASPELRTKFVERVRKNDQGIKQKVWKTEQAWEAVKDPYTYLLFGMAFFNTLVVGGVNTFNSLLINKGFGFDVLTSQLLGIPLAAMVVMLYMIMAWLVTKTKQTIYCMIAFCCINIVGTVVLITVAPDTATRPGLIVAFYLMQAFQACNPSIFTLLSRNQAGATKKSITYATTYIGWAGGNAIAPQLFQSVWAPRYIPSLLIHLGLYVCFILVCLLTRFILVRRNNRKDEAQRNSEGVVVNNNAHAFEDLTDLENPDFRYSI